MKITVTKEDIQDGDQRSATTCPVARALKRSFPTALYVGVSPRDFSIHLPNYESVFRVLPSNAQQQIRKFDESGKMDPFEFEIYPEATTVAVKET